MERRDIRTAVCVGGLVLLSYGVTPAADRFWANSAGGNFTNAANWSPNIVPASADNAHFNLTAMPAINFTANRTNANAFFNPATSGGVQFNIGANTWFVTNGF